MSKERQIEDILLGEWTVPPAKRAAMRLLNEGFSLEQLWMFNKSKTGQRMSDEWKWNTYNEMRILEK